MGRSRIEWLRDPTTGTPGFSINPVKGLCPVACDYCYARRLYKRFKWNPEIREILPGFLFEELRSIKKPSRIFWGSTFELFHDSIPDLWRKDIFAMVGQFPQHTHIFLTKRPENLIKWSPFPENVWVGMSVTKGGIGQDSTGGICSFEDIKAKVKFVSFEPLLEQVDFQHYTDFVDWVIIGAKTPHSAKTEPKIEWIQEIVESCDKTNVPVFLKNNLIPLVSRCLECLGACAKQFRTMNLLLNDDNKLRQEFPFGVAKA